MQAVSVRLANCAENAQIRRKLRYSPSETVKVDLQDRVRQRLRSLVEAGEVSHKVLGKFVGLSRSYVTRVLNNKAAISLEHLAKFCEFFQITPAELLTEPGSLIQPVKPLEAQLLQHFRQMSELQRHSLLMVLESRADEIVTPRRARWGHAELTSEQQELVDLYARVKRDGVRDGVLRTLRGAAEDDARLDQAKPHTTG